MCGRTTLFALLGEIEGRFDASFAYEYQPRYNVAPGDPGLPAIRNENCEEIEQCYWGLVPDWVEERADWPEPINARAESVADKPSFRDAFRRRRCLVLADGFYEWTGPSGNRRPHHITVDDGEPFAMAGLWEHWSNGGDENGDEVTSVTVVTTETNDVVGQLHDRMPVILTRDEERKWLESEGTDDLQALLDPFPDGRMDTCEVSTAVNNSANDGPELVEPVGGSQTGLGEFG